MTILVNYQQFAGRHWDTGPLRNALDYQGFKATHTNQPLTEALLFGISGGIVAGYFVFEYQGYEPWLHFLTRNSFEPMQRIIDQLGITTTVKHTASADKAVTNLTAVLDGGKPALVWADAHSLPYNNLESNDEAWGMLPVLVYGYDDDSLHIADRAQVPLIVDAKTFHAARGRIKKDKYRVMAVESIALDQLPAAVENGIRTCLEHMTGEPPRKQMADKYGLSAYQRWADLLLDEKSKMGWAKQFAPGPKMYAGMRMPYHYINLWDAGGQYSRQLFAEFLEEAATLLNQPALTAVADQFKQAATIWGELNQALLPDAVPVLKQTRELMQREYDLFIEQGTAALAERQQIRDQLGTIKASMAEDFPLNAAEVVDFRANLRDVVLKIHDCEQAGLAALQAAVG